MSDVKVNFRKKQDTGANWDSLLFKSSSELVSRQSNPSSTVETDLSEVETLLSGTRFYHTLASISETLSMTSTMSQICALMADGSVAMYANTSGAAGVYPTAYGTVMIYKISSVYCIAIYNDITTNYLYSGTYTNDGSSVTWSGWAGGSGAPAIIVDTEITEGSANPVSGGAVYTRFASTDQTLSTLNTTVSRLNTTITNHAANTTMHCTSAEKTAWNSKPAVVVSSTQPTGQTTNDLWFQPL